MLISLFQPFSLPPSFTSIEATATSSVIIKVIIIIIINFYFIIKLISYAHFVHVVHDGVCAARRNKLDPKAKATKKKKMKDKKEDQRNPKAFAYCCAIKAARSRRRTLDIKEKGHHLSPSGQDSNRTPSSIY